MVITLRIVGQEPIEGVAELGDEDAITFVGWLGLLRALSELLPSRRDARPADGLGSELNA